ncbi:MAG: NIL domain-containing protein [Armatimonadetes bacterium]|nr:NIL domain-containing protein [Armatimonadota bacterium]MDE2205322.1 NIL domain-containing protein [Armatimonadota bacterium]
MPTMHLTLAAAAPHSSAPILWRVARKFHVAANLRRAYITGATAVCEASFDGSQEELDQARQYLADCGMLPEKGSIERCGPLPEEQATGVATLHVAIEMAARGQGDEPVLCRLGRDHRVVVNILSAAFDAAEGGWLEIALTGPLGEVQRAIAWLCTTGLHVSPHERSVSDSSNL